MIDISFLKRPTPLPFEFSGLEYLDWQNKSSVFNELKTVLEDAFNPTLKVFDFNRNVRAALSGIIKNNLQMNVDIVAGDVGPAVDTGYVIPGSVLNNRGIEDWYGKQYSKFAEAFKDLKKNVIKGYADPKTGKLEGDYRLIPFSIFLDGGLFTAKMEERLLKYGSTAPEAYAAFILHECGHIFSTLLYVSSKILDNAIVAQATKMYLKESDKSKRTTILKEASAELGAIGDVPTTDLDEDGVVIYFSKNIVNRDYRRSLSLGVATMTSEVLADAYAARFGAGHHLVSGLAALGFVSLWDSVKVTALIALIFTLFTGVSFMFLFTIGMIGFWTGYHSAVIVGDIYDSPYRRLKTILRDSITEIQTSGSTGAEKLKGIEALRKMDKIVEENKTFYESKAYQRLIGWMLNGSDFRKNDFENYTADLISTRLSLYSEGYFTS